jgi:hypothetical protein
LQTTLLTYLSTCCDLPTNFSPHDISLSQRISGAYATRAKNMLCKAHGCAAQSTRRRTSRCSVSLKRYIRTTLTCCIRLCCTI